MGASFSGFTRWLNQDCACSRLFLAWKKLTRAATHSRPAKPMPAPIPAFAPVLRVVEVEGAFTSAMGAVVVVGVAVWVGMEDVDVALEESEDVALEESEDVALEEAEGAALEEAEDVALVLLDEAEDEDIDSVVTVVLASI
jgi:hypothetical protein